MAEKRRVPRAKRPGAYMTKKGGVVKNAKVEARAKVTAKRDAARKKVDTLVNRWKITGAEIRSGPLMKKPKSRVVAKSGKKK